MAYAPACDQVMQERIDGCLPMVSFLVRKVSRWLPACWDRDEMESIGLSALVRAAQRFDPERGVKFSSLAYIYISSDLHKHLDREHRRLEKFARLNSLDSRYEAPRRVQPTPLEELILREEGQNKKTACERALAQLCPGGADLANRGLLTFKGLARALAKRHKKSLRWARWRIVKRRARMVQVAFRALNGME